MKKAEKKKYVSLIHKYANDIIYNATYKTQKMYMQHGVTSVLEHEINVTIYALKIANTLRLKVDEKTLIRGCLLHDYFLYDWHTDNNNHGLHGFTHAKTALNNASNEFELNKIERNMIYCHMFPLNLRVPKYKESIILCIADKIVATKETIHRKRGLK